MSDWYYRKDDRIIGPVSRQELEFLAREGRIRSATEVRSGKAGEWKRFRNDNRSAKPNSVFVAASEPTAEANKTEALADAPSAEVVASGPPALESDSDQTRRQAAIGGALALLLLLLLWFFWAQYSGSSLSGSTNSKVAGGLQQESVQGAGKGEADDGDPDQLSAGQTDDAAATVADVGEDQSQAGQPLDNSGEGNVQTQSAGMATEDNAQSTASVEPANDKKQDDDLATMTMDGQDSIQAGDPMSKFTISAPGEAVFFGLRATGNRFAFVVDHSGSMSGDRLQRAQQELMNCIHAMPKHVEVFIVFFNSFATPDTALYRKVDAKNLKQLKQWVDSMSASGGTEVGKGMEEVFKRSELPDSIFLLTDGDFDPSTPEFINRLNADGKVRINTVALVSRQGERLLKKIAADNAGDYKYVP